jgi:hypothetical protein
MIIHKWISSDGSELPQPLTLKISYHYLHVGRVVLACQYTMLSTQKGSQICQAITGKSKIGGLNSQSDNLSPRAGAGESRVFIFCDSKSSKTLRASGIFFSERMSLW